MKEIVLVVGVFREFWWEKKCKASFPACVNLPDVNRFATS